MSGVSKRATVVSVVLTLLGSVPVAEAAFPGQNGKIAFDAGGQVRTVNADGSGAAVVGPGVDPAWSPDGTRLLFRGDFSFRITTADGSPVTTIPAGFGRDPIWSPDDTRIAFVLDRPWDDQSYPDEIVVVNVDGSGETQITAGGCPNPTNFSPCDEIQSLSWEPNGNRIAYTRAQWVLDPECECEDEYLALPRRVWFADPDAPGTETVMPTSPIASGVDWEPNGQRLLLSGTSVRLVLPNGTGLATVRPSGWDAEWSPDGTRIVYSTASTGGDIHASAYDGTQVRTVVTGTGASDPAWQPLQPPPPQATYVRPKGAGPFDAALVVAYRDCPGSNQNRVHGPPLEHASCSPPAQASAFLTVGTPDANGAAANAIGKVRLAVIPGSLATPADEADVNAAVSIADVRIAGSLNDYAGEVGIQLPIRIVDRANTGPGPGVVTDTTFTVPVPCAPTGDTTIGSTCALNTTFDAVVPGVITEGKRTMWEVLGRLQVIDGGPDGDVDTVFNTVFLTQGVFVP